jgi:hypothetical protein
VNVDVWQPLCNCVRERRRETSRKIEEKVKRIDRKKKIEEKDKKRKNIFETTPIVKKSGSEQRPFATGTW